MVIYLEIRKFTPIIFQNHSFGYVHAMERDKKKFLSFLFAPMKIWAGKNDEIVKNALKMSLFDCSPAGNLFG